MDTVQLTNEDVNAIGEALNLAVADRLTYASSLGKEYPNIGNRRLKVRLASTKFTKRCSGK